MTSHFPQRWSSNPSLFRPRGYATENLFQLKLYFLAELELKHEV